MKLFARYSVASVAALVVISGLASAGQFKSIKGVHEFSGMLIVRPLQLDDMMNKSWSLDRIKTLRTRVNSKFSLNLVRYIPDTDEYVVKIPKGSDENKYSQALLASGDYQYAQPRWICYPTTTPNDPRYPSQWHHVTIHSPQAWSLWTGRSTFITSFVDTGVLKTHEDLKDLLLPGYNSVDRKTEAQGGDVTDIQGHGTHVMGCGSAEGNNSIGVSGVAWNHRILPVRTSNSSGGGASIDDILDGARWAVANGAKTVSASYSGVDDPAIGTTGTWIKQHGGLFFYAAGNDNRDLSGFSYPDVVVVGASDVGDIKAWFSAYGKGVSVFAPGVNILSTTRDGAYGFASGTSMATPVTNGATALIWSVNPDLLPDDVQQILYSTCDNIGSSAIFGNGRINVERGVDEAFATLTQDASIASAIPFTGTWSAGDLFSIRDTNVLNSYDIGSSYIRGMGEVAAATMTFFAPTNAVYRSVGFEADVNITGGKPSTVYLYIYNFAKAKYEYLKAQSIASGATTHLALRITANPANYVGVDGTISVILRSLVPARFGTANSTFKIGYATGHYTIRPNL